MKKLLIVVAVLFLAKGLNAQRTINDRSIRYQQERMVFKQWNRDRFSPEPGFLYTNPLYWMTWALHPNYPKTDLRPLGPAGPQTQRLGLVLAMQNTENSYKKHSDTLSNTAISEAVNYSSIFSSTDPLWLWYYGREFRPLLEMDQNVILDGIGLRERDYLVRSGVYLWFVEEAMAIRERLEAAMTTTVDRGSRITAYHRLLGEYRKALASWESKRQYARRFLSLRDNSNEIKDKGRDFPVGIPKKTDRQIAEGVVGNSKL